MNTVVSVASVACASAIAVPAITGTSSADDPIFAIIEKARRMEIAFEAEDESADFLNLCSVRAELARTVPTTPEGLAALTGFLCFAHNQLHGAAPYFVLSHFVCAVFNFGWLTKRCHTTAWNASE